MDKIDLGSFNFTVCPAGREVLPEKTIIFRTACVSVENGEMECIKKGVPGVNCDNYVVFPLKKMLLGGGWQQCYTECFTTYSPNGSISPNTTSTQVIDVPANAAVTAYPTFIITFAALLFVLLLSSKRSH